MSPELVSILALVLMFVIATVLPVNIGVLAFVGAFLVGSLLTDLFAIAQNNGTVDWLASSPCAVRGRVAAVPWIMFGIAAVLTAVGAVSPGRSRSSPRSRSASRSSSGSTRCSWA